MPATYSRGISPPRSSSGRQETLSRSESAKPVNVIQALRIQAEDRGFSSERLDEETRTLMQKVEAVVERHLSRRSVEDYELLQKLCQRYESRVHELEIELKHTENEYLESQKRHMMEIDAMRTTNRMHKQESVEARQQSEDLAESNSKYEVTIKELRRELGQLQDQATVRYNNVIQSTTSIDVPERKGRPQAGLSLGDEPPTPKSMLSELKSASRSESENRESASTVKASADAEPHVQAEFFRVQMALYEKEQDITRLKQELEDTRAGTQRRVARIAHTELISGSPTDIMNLINPKLPSDRIRLSRKQTFGEINKHRASEIRTKMTIDPIRWIGRDQNIHHYRPKVSPDRNLVSIDSANLACSPSEVVKLKSRLSVQLRLPVSNEEEGESGKSDDDDEDEEGGQEGEEEEEEEDKYQEDEEDPDSSFSDQPLIKRYGGRVPNAEDAATVEIMDSEGEEGPGSEHIIRLQPRASEAVRAWSQLASDFELETGAVPFVHDQRLVFRTSEDQVSNLRARKALGNVYRVGRDVLGEMR